jgi:hypothetical protein
MECLPVCVQSGVFVLFCEIKNGALDLTKLTCSNVVVYLGIVCVVLYYYYLSNLAWSTEFVRAL